MDGDALHYPEPEDLGNMRDRLRECYNFWINIKRHLIVETMNMQNMQPEKWSI